MEKLVDSTIKSSIGEETAPKQQQSVLETKREKLEERYAFGEIC